MTDQRNPQPTAPDNLARNSALNALGTALVYLAYLVATFVSNKILVGVLGAVVFGLFQVCLRLLSYVTPGEGPVSQALKWIIANRHAKADDQDLKRTVGSALVLWGWLSAGILLLGALVSWQAPFFMRDIPAGMEQVVRLTCLVLVLRTIASNGGRVFVAPVQGVNLAYKVTFTDALLEVVRGGLLIGAASLGLGLLGLAQALLLTALVSVGLYWRLARRWVPWFGIARPGRRDLDRFSDFGGWLLASNVLYRVLLMSDIVLLGWVAGGARVSVLTFSQYVCNFGVTVVVLAAVAVAPGLGRLLGSGELERARAIREELLALCWLSTVVVAVGVLVWNGAFVAMWVGREFYTGPEVNALIVLLFAQTAFIRLDGLVIDVSLDIRRKVAWTAVATLLGVVLAVVLGRTLHLGMAGVLLGMGIGRGVLSLAYPLIAARTLGAQRAGLGLAFARATTVALLLMGGAALLGARMPDVPVPTLLGGGLLTGLVAAVVAWFAGLDGVMRARLVRRVQSLGLVGALRARLGR